MLSCKKLLVCCFKKVHENLPHCLMSHESVSSYVLSKCVLCHMKECLVMSNERVSCHVSWKGVLLCPMKGCLVMSQERVSCHVPWKSVLSCPTKGCLVMSHKRVSCYVQWNGVLSCPMKECLVMSHDLKKGCSFSTFCMLWSALKLNRISL